MAQKKIQPSDGTKLKSLLSEESLDEKFDEFYTDRPSNSKDDVDLANQEKIDFKELYETHVAPVVGVVSKRIVGLAKTVAPAMSAVAGRAVRKVGFVGISLGVVGLVVAVAVVNLFGGATSDPAADEGTGDVQGVSVVENNVSNDAPFEILQSDTAAELRYDEDRQVASYGDLVDGRQIIVSQQQLLPDQQLNEQFLLQVATSFNIQTEYQSDKGGVFIGENREQQSQTAIFKHDDKLVFIQIIGNLSTAQIIQYVNQL